MQASDEAERAAKINVALEICILMSEWSLNHDYIKSPFIRDARVVVIRTDANRVGVVTIDAIVQIFQLGVTFLLP